MAEIVLVVAASLNNVIGVDGELPWRLPSDLKRFRKMTMGKPIIMGRKTFESIGKPLDGRANIVVTRNPEFAIDGVLVASSVEAAIQTAKDIAAETNADEIAVIGGGEIYRQALEFAETVYLTRVHREIDGDTFFPELDDSVWAEIRAGSPEQGENDSVATSLHIFKRRN